jgi:DNA-directed RNA polymerase specialized sigma subunit
MKSNKEILEQYGNLLANEVFDNQYRFILNKISDLAQTEGYINLFHNMSVSQKKELEYYTREILKGAIFDFLRIFEEHPEFKLVYEEGTQQVDLNKISEMLKAEPIIDNGWLRRFSRELNNESLT